MNTIDNHAADLIQSLTTASTRAQSIDGSVHFATPNDYTLHNLDAAIEKNRIAPSRKKGTLELLSLDSLITYCNDQGSTAKTEASPAMAANTSYIYADTNSCSLTAVFNDQRADLTGWRDHRATFKPEQTKECTLWMSRNGHSNKFTQEGFAEFIEDNIADIIDGQQLLEMATTIAATSGIQFRSAKRLQDGQTQLSYYETIDAKAGADGAMTIPKTFKLALRIFKNDSTGYGVEARLKYRLNGSGGVSFYYEIMRPEHVIEDAFNGYITKLREATGYVVLTGKP